MADGGAARRYGTRCRMAPPVLRGALSVRTFLLERGRDRWQVCYDGERRTVTVAGPSSASSQIHRWLTSPHKVVNRISGDMVTLVPTSSWEYLRQAVETDLYHDLQMRAVFE